MAKKHADLPIFDCAINAKCRMRYRDPCNWDCLCTHYVVSGCIPWGHWDMPNGRASEKKCVSCGIVASKCDTKKLLSDLHDPDYEGLTQDQLRTMVQDCSPGSR
jgi:hypothetical protein